MSLGLVIFVVIWYVGLLMVIAAILVVVRLISRHETLREVLRSLLSG